MYNTQITDALGKEILPGNYILYTTRHGSGVYLKGGKILSIEIEERYYRRLPEIRINIIGIDITFGDGKASKRILHTTGHIIVVPESMLPDHVLNPIKENDDGDKRRSVRKTQD